MNKSTLELLGDLPPPSHSPDKANQADSSITLGFLGHSSAAKWTQNSITDLILNPCIGEIKKLPNTILIPTEGTTSTLLQIWAERLNIPYQAIDSDWSKLGRKARALRDGRILKEASHLVFFLGSRSDYYEKIAIREVKKGRKVFAVDPKSGILEEWI
jgi:hypothetical protein